MAIEEGVVVRNFPNAAVAGQVLYAFLAVMDEETVNNGGPADIHDRVWAALTSNGSLDIQASVANPGACDVLIPCTFPAGNREEVEQTIGDILDTLAIMFSEGQFF